MMDSVQFLRIRIPPYEEIEEDLVLPPWPKRVGTIEEKIHIDRTYLDGLADIIALRRSLVDRFRGASEVMKYLYMNQTLLEEYPAYAQDIYSYAEKYMKRADDLEASGHDETAIYKVTERVKYYGMKLCLTITAIQDDTSRSSLS